VTSTPDQVPFRGASPASGQRLGHRAHLELAWRCLEGADYETARRRTQATLREVASSHGTPERFHLTLTWSWLHLVALHRQWSSNRSFDAFLDAHDALLDTELVSRHYHERTLWCEAARTRWIDPDRRPFPALSEDVAPGRRPDRRDA
jgi:hypothetical protein